MPITKEQWAEIEKELSFSYGVVKLQADGYAVTAQVQSIAPLRNGIVIFINGFSEGKWCFGKDKEARKFLQERKRFLYPAKARDTAKMWLRKRGLGESKAYWKDVAEKTVSAWCLYWTSPKSMTRQWRKTCKDIEVVGIGYAAISAAEKAA